MIRQHTVYLAATHPYLAAFFLFSFFFFACGTSMTSLSWVDSRGPLRSLVTRESPASLHETKKVSSFFFHIRLYRFFFFLRFIFEMPFLLTDALLPFPLSLLSEGHHISSTPLCVFAVAAITAYCSFYYYHYCVWMCVLCSSVSSLSPLIRGRSSFPFFFFYLMGLLGRGRGNIGQASI